MATSGTTTHHNAILRPRALTIFPGSYAVGTQVQGFSQLDANTFRSDAGTPSTLAKTASKDDSFDNKRKSREPLPRVTVLIAPSDSWRDALRETFSWCVWTDPQLWKAGLIEFAISMIFTFISGSIGVTVSGYPPYVLGPALFVISTTVVSLAIYAFSQATGAHINPLISIATMLVGLTHPVRCIIYVVCQIAGACVGGSFLRGGLGYTRALETHNGGCFLDPNGPVSVGQAAAIEFMSTFALLMIVFGVGLDPRQKQLYGATLGPFLVGLTVGMIAFSTSGLNVGYTGAGVFPSRCLGLAVGIGKFYSHDWIWWVPDLAAAAVHALLYFAAPPYTREMRCPEERVTTQAGPKDSAV